MQKNKHGKERCPRKENTKKRRSEKIKRKEVDHEKNKREKFKIKKKKNTKMRKKKKKKIGLSLIGINSSHHLLIENVLIVCRKLWDQRNKLVFQHKIPKIQDALLNIKTIFL